MELVTHRYRNPTALVLAIVAQLLLLGYQVKNGEDMRLIRVWAVTAVTPAARLLEAVRSSVSSVLHNYVILVGAREENRRLSTELGKLKLENQYLRGELTTAERARALQSFQARIPSRTITARIIGAGTGADSKVVFVGRGSGDGVARGMAVITPDGIVGRVSAAYSMTSQVVLITDPSFAAGVISQKNHVQGTLKGQGRDVCIVDYVQNEEKVDVGEWFFTSGDDRVFPRGLPAGQVSVARNGKALKEIHLAPSGFRNGIEEVLVVLEGVHQPVPAVAEERQAADLPPPDLSVGGEEAARKAASSNTFSTDADRLIERYRRIGEAQGHVFGEGAPGTPPPDFNRETGGPSPIPEIPKSAPSEPQPGVNPQQQ